MVAYVDNGTQCYYYQTIIIYDPYKVKEFIDNINLYLKEFLHEHGDLVVLYFKPCFGILKLKNYLNANFLWDINKKR